ncbi:nucleotidyltransferase domain-containing protein [Streptomyces sp. NPDC004561]
MFAGADFPWWIAGGYAIELAVGRELRPHGDLDVLVLRRDQPLAREMLSDWDMHVADPPGAGRFRPWRPGETLEVPLHDIWCRRTRDALVGAAHAGRGRGRPVGLAGHPTGPTSARASGTEESDRNPLPCARGAALLPNAWLRACR